jgi:iron complex outermembrane receptor protein
MTTEIFGSYKFTRIITGYIGVDNIFNVHPDYGYVKAAAGWDYNNETGGAWDAVQMGFDGMRMFARLAFNL